MYTLTITVLYFFPRSLQNGKKSKTVKQNYEAFFTDQVEDDGTTEKPVSDMMLQNLIFLIWAVRTDMI